MTRDQKLKQVCKNCGKLYQEHMKVAIGRICEGVLFRPAVDPNTAFPPESRPLPADKEKE